MSEPGNGFEYRFRKLEDAIISITRRLDHIDEHGSRRVDVIGAELQHVRQDFADLAGEIRDLKTDMRDTRHRLTAGEGAATLLSSQVGKNSEKVDGLVKSIVVGFVGLGVVVIGSIATSWLAFGGPP